MRVAVIGAGATGLAALRHLATRPDFYDFVAYEALSHVGGTWSYCQKIGAEETTKPVKGSMYQNLRTNLPKEIMAFPGYPFDKSLRSYIGHSDVQSYLENFADHYHLRRFIKFNRWVKNIRCIPVEGRDTWEVDSSEYLGSETMTETDTFDVVMVCNGHYSYPYLPDIEGMSDFEGSIVHSRQHRTPDRYTDRTVLLLGARASGVDLSVDVSKAAKRVILSHRNCPLVTTLPDNVFQRFGIKQFTKTGVVFSDGQKEERVDDVILCTGYEYKFPFLDPTCEIAIQDNRASPLYRHLVNVNHPTMFFLGICLIILPFPHFDLQVRYVLALLEEKFKLPEKERMLEWIENDYVERLEEGWKHKHAHVLHDKQWKYADDLGDEAGIFALKPVLERIYEHCRFVRETNVLTYRELEYTSLNDEEFEWRG